jgi:uncharacterized protein (DUF58 family)
MSPVSRRFRLLHAFYSRGASIQFWLKCRMRRAGICALLATSAASFLSIGNPKAPIFQLFSFSFGLVLLALIWTFMRRATVHASIRTPKYATVGEEILYSATLHHNHRTTKRGLRLLQIPPDPRPSLIEFSQIEEPHEQTRNIYDRKMAYFRWRWLMTRHRSFSAEENTHSFDLPPRQNVTVNLSLIPHKRGVYLLENLRLLMPDPLGFFQKCRALSPNPARLIALPKRYRLPPFEMPGSSTFHIGGEDTSNSIGNSGEFIGLRDYRPGDSPRNIHWKSWAHTGKPIVKELEDTYYPRYALILDTFPHSPDPMIFEEMISIASSFITGLDQHQALIDLMFIADQAHTITAGRGLERTEKLLEVLAEVKMELNDRFENLSTTVIRHRDQITSCLIILNGWNETRQAFIEKIRKANIPCVPIIVGTGEKPNTLIGHWINSQQVAQDLMRLPAQLIAI